MCSCRPFADACLCVYVLRGCVCLSVCVCVCVCVCVHDCLCVIVCSLLSTPLAMLLWRRPAFLSLSFTPMCCSTTCSSSKRPTLRRTEHSLDLAVSPQNTTRRGTQPRYSKATRTRHSCPRPVFCASYCVPDGSAAYVDARDLADCVLSVMLNPQRFQSRQLHLTGKEAVDGATIAEAMSLCYQTSIVYRVVSEAEVRAVLERVGVPGWMSDDILAMEHMREAALLHDITSVVKDTCGHPPRTLMTFLSHYKSQLSPGFSIKQVLNFFL